MKHYFGIPALTCALLLAGAQSGWAQAMNPPADKSVSAGHDANHSRATTHTSPKNVNPKVAKDSRHCTANQNFVKQGDHMICVPRTTNDSGMPMGKEKAQ
ncbi:MAG TPA: hypothetical protein VFO10_24775 [Oligoflexus sp.]|uniref:hypothetical protein n=1 Tax=Oligoflexus sp. TaxID=1971216 RepID=UPI002D7F178D|nr:hypothetical protein [Oligoflexus sp.]HET9240502.1 hypothetical protein [Oligoflexus sp.]